MPGRFEQKNSAEQAAPIRRRRRRRRRNYKPVILLAAVVLLVILTIILWPKKEHSDTQDPSGTQAQQESTGQEETEPPVEVIASASISAQGDLLMHKPIITACAKEEEGYDFTSIFRYIKTTLAGYDYSVANLETTFGGAERPYQGNPRFNCPDEFADAVADAGYDMLLTANNHSSDTYTDGILRTVNQVRDRGLATLGTMLSDTEKKYTIVDLNGIQIGMLCYTYATNENGDGYPSLNYKEFVTEKGIVNYFTENDLEQFYSEVQALLLAMESEGAEATILYIHWGTEYETQENAVQQAMAQRLCDLGVDVIVGGHPHVVQPVDLLTSNTDPNHRTICIYSVGNALSNQVKEADEAFASGHSEDGVLFELTFEEYSDGTVAVAQVDILPTWLLRCEDETFTPVSYQIIPLNKAQEGQWAEMFGLTVQDLASAQQSYERTMAIVGDGLAQCQTYLEQTRSALLGHPAE